MDRRLKRRTSVKRKSTSMSTSSEDDDESCLTCKTIKKTPTPNIQRRRGKSNEIQLFIGDTMEMEDDETLEDSIEMYPHLQQTGNVGDNFGIAVGVVQGNVNQTVQQILESPVETDEEIRRRMIKDLRHNLQQSFLKQQMKHIPWMKKPLTVEDDYVDLCLVTQDIDGVQEQHKKLTIDDLLVYIGIENKFTLIEGKPGYGKTTMASKIAQKWVEGELASFDLVFKLEFKLLNKESVRGFLCQQFPRIYNEDILQALEYCRVLFILDGLDEIPRSMKETSIKFLRDIAFRDNFHALITSRPTPLVQHINIKFSSKVIIKGFCDEGRITFVNQYFEKGGSSNVDKILKKLEKDNNVSDLCECPLMLLLFCFLVDNNPRDYKLPDTLTDLYKHIVNFVINRYYEKTTNAKITAEEFDLFGDNLSKEMKLILKNLNSFGEKALKAIKENRVVFNETEIEGDLLLRIGFLIRISPTDALVEPFHRSITEFLCGMFLLKLFSDEETKFHQLFPEFLSCVEKEESLILPFLCGFLKEKSTNVIRLIPEWFYFGNWGNYLTLSDQCERFLTDKSCLFRLIPPDLHLDLTINNNELVMLNNRLKQKLGKYDYIWGHKWSEWFVSVHHNSSEYHLNHNSVTNLQGSKVSLVTIQFPCQNVKERSIECSEKPFSQSQLGILTDEILNLKPNSVEINFPHCDECFSFLLERISKLSFHLNRFCLSNFRFRSEEVKTISSIICKQKIKILHLRTEVNCLVLTERKHVEIRPLVEAIQNPVCVLHRLNLFDLTVCKEEFTCLMDSLSKSETVKELAIKFTSPSEHVVDLSHLCNTGKHWERIYLKHIQVILSSQSSIAIDTLSLLKCTVSAEDSVRILTFCQIRFLYCNCEFLNVVFLESKQVIASSQTLYLLIIADETVDVSHQIFSKFNNLTALMFDFRDGFGITKSNKEHLVPLLSGRETSLNVGFYLTFDTKEYLNVLDFIVECFQSIDTNNPPTAKINSFLLTFEPQDKASNEANSTSLQRRETDTLLQVVSKLNLFVSSGFFNELVIRIAQSTQRGHFFGPFLSIHNYFPSEEFQIHYEFQTQWNYLEWTITKRME